MPLGNQRNTLKFCVMNTIVQVARICAENCSMNFDPIDDDTIDRLVTETYLKTKAHALLFALFEVSSKTLCSLLYEQLTERTTNDLSRAFPSRMTSW